MSCFDNVALPSCVWFAGGDRRNVVSSIVASFLFFTGWWIIIDVASYYPGELEGAAYVCGVFSTIAFIMINSVSNAQVRGESYSGGCMGPRGAQLWLFIGFVMSFAALIAACGVLFAKYVHATHTWPGVGLFLQNSLIFIATMVYKFGRSEDVWG